MTRVNFTPWDLDPYVPAMQRAAKERILGNLDPANPESMQALIDFHRAAFGGWKMEGEGGDPEGQKPDGESDKGGEKPPADKPDEKLGDGGIKALQAERDARKALEAQLAQLKTGLATALGVEAKDAKSSTDDIVATLQQQMSDLNHSNLVLSVANENQITDKEDLALLRSIKDEDALRKFAARIKPSTEEAKPGQKGQRKPPSPDPSQGQGGGTRTAGKDAGLAEAQRRGYVKN